MAANQWSSLEAYVEEFMKKEQIPGAAIAIAQHGRVLYEQGFGYRDLQSKEAVTPQTVFGVASITKSMTALAIVKLAELGQLDIQAPVTRYVPEFKFKDTENMDAFRIHHLLTHTTGQPPMKRREELTDFNDHLSYIGSYSMERLGSPGEYFSYCNDTFLILGAIIERVTGEPYESFVTKAVLDPLQMNRSTFDLQQVKQLEDVSTPYIKDLQTGEVQEAPWPALGNYTVGGGVRSCVRDLLKYGSLFTDEAANDFVKKMWHPHYQIDEHVYYGYALEVTKTNKGITWVKHGGAQPGVSAHFGFVPEEGLVVAVLTNLAKVPVRNLWLAAVNHVLGYPLTETHVTYAMEPMTEEKMQKMLGVYATVENGKCVISLEDGQLQATFESGEILKLRPLNHRTVINEKDGSPIHFYFKDDQEDAWAFMHQRRMWTRVK